MVQTRNIAKRRKTEECKPCMELVMFNNDSLYKIASYLPADGLLNLALTCRQFGIVPTRSSGEGESDSLSLVEETARRIVQDIATEEEMAVLPRYDGENWLSKYNYLQLLQMPLTFDQLVGLIEYVDEKKSCVAQASNNSPIFSTAFSNNIMMAGKHYVSFEASHRTGTGLLLGVMRPGEAMQSAQGFPLFSSFCEHFTQRNGSWQHNNRVDCCMYDSSDGYCWSSDWVEGDSALGVFWEGMEGLSGSFTVGMLLDLDEGTLSVYKNERKLGVMKRGLAGHYCWAVSLANETQVSIKRGPVPTS